MAYADPQTVTVSTVAKTLARTGSGLTSGVFQSADGMYRLDVTHELGKRQRHTVRLTETKISADAFVPTNNTRSSTSAYFVVNMPNVGYTAAEAKAIGDALTAVLAASSGAFIAKLIGGES